MIKPFSVSLLCLTAPIAAHGQAQPADPAPITAQTLLQSSQTIVGDTIVYPDGDAEITVLYITVEPGAYTGWHLHPVPLFAQIEAGTLTVDYGSRGVHTYNPGDVMLEALDWPHNGHNAGTEPVTILAVYMGEIGGALSHTATEQ